jgi:hypothetical protein
MRILKLFFISFAVSYCLNISAKEIYVSPKGNDRNPGNIEKPLASLNGARDLIRKMRTTENLKEEVRIIIGDGTYFMDEPLILNEFDSGSEEAPVVFISEAGAKPVFIGGIQINNWEKVSDKLWKTNVKEVRKYDWYFEQLFVNGNRAVRAKSPNNGFYFLDKVTETKIDKGSGRQARVAVQSLKLFSDAAGEMVKFSRSDFNDAVITFYHKWDNTKKRILSFNMDSSVIYTTGTGMKSWNPLNSKTRYLIENYSEALDTAGEWYLSRNGDLFYMPLEGETIENLKVIAPTIDKLIIIEGNSENGKKAENIRFENLTFEVSGYQMPLWGNEAAQAASPVEAAIMVDMARNIHFMNCEIAHTGSNAIWFRKACSDCSVVHCYLNDLAAGGVKIGVTSVPSREQDLTRNIVVDNNIIRSGGYIFPCAVGVIIFNASDNTITHNEIANFRYSGISVGWIWGYAYSPSKRNNISFNHIHHLGWGELDDMGGVYCLGESSGTRIANNVIHHISSFDYGGWGLYTDEGSANIVMENNLVYACKNSGYQHHYGKDNIIRNNILSMNINGQLQATRIEQHSGFTFTNNIVYFNSGTLFANNWGKINLSSDKNCYWDTRTTDIRFDDKSFSEWQKSGKDIHSIIADPGFVNPENFDFRFKKTSVAKKIGFVPFDYSLAGVYGSDDWKKLAQFDEKLAEQFDRAIAKFR